VDSTDSRSEGVRLDVPVVLIFFKRIDKTIQVLDRIAQARPSKLYLISDGPRDAAEAELVEECRRRVDARIDWDCDVVRDYAPSNRGVYDRIGLSALRILAIEPAAIFLEDDNLPEVSFFRFCEEMLERYRGDDKVFWICGTNYLESYEPQNRCSYVFTRHMLPCGWASWGHKFAKLYDGDMKLLDDPKTLPEILARSGNKALTRQHIRNWLREKGRIVNGQRPNSWDYQMSLTLEGHQLLGIVPVQNQIRNIGVDEFSIHGGHDINNVMTRRFCGMGSHPLTFPLNHCDSVDIDERFDRLTGALILLPLRYRIRGALNRLLRAILRVEDSTSLNAELARRFGFGVRK
jgi:hypothetical protein